MGFLSVAWEMAFSTKMTQRFLIMLGMSVSVLFLFALYCFVVVFFFFFFLFFFWGGGG